MSSDLIADSMTRIRNAQRAGHKSVSVRCSSLVEAFLEVLKGEGFVQSFERCKDGDSGFDRFEVSLKYYSSGEPVINVARRVSSSGRRVYKRVGDLPTIFNGLGMAVLSTSQGVISDREARKRKIGGEILAYIG